MTNDFPIMKCLCRSKFQNATFQIRDQKKEKQPLPVSSRHCATKTCLSEHDTWEAARLSSPPLVRFFRSRSPVLLLGTAQRFSTSDLPSRRKNLATVAEVSTFGENWKKSVRESPDPKNLRSEKRRNPKKTLLVRSWSFVVLISMPQWFVGKTLVVWSARRGNFVSGSIVVRELFGSGALVTRNQFVSSSFVIRYYFGRGYYSVRPSFVGCSLLVCQWLVYISSQLSRVGTSRGVFVMISFPFTGSRQSFHVIRQSFVSFS